MNGFMVSYAGDMDDLACGLFPTAETAGEFAAEVIAEVRAADARGKSLFAGPILSKISEVYSRDFGTFNCIAIVEFRDGVPVDYDVVFGEDDLLKPADPQAGIRLASE